MAKSSWTRPVVRGCLLFFLASGVAAGGYVLAVVPPSIKNLYPPCMLHATTGLHCPGCGTTRCLHSLLNGEIRQAFAYNIFAPVFVPVLAGVIGLTTWHAVRGTRSRLREPSRMWIFGSIAVLGAFFVLRNIPASPFTLLAPHKI